MSVLVSMGRLLSTRSACVWRVLPVALGASALSLACSAEGDGAGPDPFSTNGGTGGNTGGPNPIGANGGTGGSLSAGGASGSEGVTPVGGVSGQGNGGAGGAASNAGGASSGGSASGAAGNGGSAGTNGVGGTGATAGASCEDGTAFLCDGFESATAGAFPSGVWVPNACTSHTVDGAVARTGTKSLRAGPEMYPACMAHADVSAESEIYARSWIRLGASSTLSGHEVGLLEFGPTTADNPEVRIGFRDNDSVCREAPGLEVTVDGVAGGERTTCSGLALDAERWYCLEVHFSRSPGRIAFGVQIDGASVVPETEYTDATSWGDGPMFLKLGRSAYGGNQTWPVWHDDVIVSSQPVGCAN